jgi:1,4-dihydroxy-2-naphthoate octaprenyltransferase
MVYYGSALIIPAEVPWEGMLISLLLFGGFYPLTQIYQHEQDVNDGVYTISYVLGINGTFIFSAVFYLIAEGALFFYFNKINLNHFYLLQLFFIPIVLYFLLWWTQTGKNNANADFHHAMRMNLIAATSMNIAFIIILMMNIYS